MRKLIKAQWYKYLLYILFSILLIFLFFEKENYMSDELMTYNLANATASFAPVDGELYSPAASAYVDGMVSDGRFDIANVWKRQAEDTHPPLYYLLVHAVCTYFPNSFSLCYAGVVNILFALLTLYFVRKLFALFVPDSKVQLFFALQYILCSGILAINMLLRMYGMAMFFVTVFTYVILKNLPRYTLKSLVGILFITVGGALTHYYFIVYAFFLSVAVVLVMLFGRRVRETLLYCLTMAVAGGISILIFPAMLTHLFGGYRSREAVEYLGGSDKAERLRTYFRILDEDLFGRTLVLLGAVILALLLIRFIKCRRRQKQTAGGVSIDALRYGCVLFAAIGYFLVISLTTMFWVDRYISPVYAVVFGTVFSLLYKALSGLLKSRRALIAYGTAAVLVCAACYVLCDFDYLRHRSAWELTIAEIHGPSSSAIVVYSGDDTAWMLLPSYLEIAKCQDAVFYHADSFEEFEKAFKADGYEYDDAPAFFLMLPDNAAFITQFEREYPEYTLLDAGFYEYVNSYYYGSVNK